MNLEPLEQYGLQALREKRHGEFQILIKRLFHEKVALGQIPMKDEVEALRVN